MTPAESLFAEALTLPASEREAFVEHACGGDESLRARALALIRAYASAQGFLEDGSTNLLNRRTPKELADLVGTRIGSYKLLQKIGEGGCGVVFMADQEEPVRRRVALKVIKLGMDTKDVIARFEAERQALALMEHPNIARVLDAGATDTGRPFFVMELVRGVPITRYCDEQKLGTIARVRLFIDVCRAVQHAHQKGIIHRDLKPSNILVTSDDGVAMPKVIDFGIAKAIPHLRDRLTDQTLFTAFELFIGTPAYMSPEQTEMSSQDVDTRSDIYSLGVLLYELLTGRTPFESRALLKSGLDEMRRVIREQEPAKPSTRVSTLAAADCATIAQQRGTEPAKLVSRLRGDLDWIVMRCLEKKRIRRYETANGLAADLERHLANQPVVARPPSTLYLLQRTFRRNRLAFSAGAAVVVALGAGLALSTLALRRERVVRQEAQVEAERSAQVAQLMKNMLAGVGPQVAMGRDTSLLRTVLDETVVRLPQGMSAQPEVEADLRTTLGNVYRDLGELRSAALMHEIALELRRRVHGSEHLAVADSMMQLGEVYARQNKVAEAEAIMREALALREKRLGHSHPDVAESRSALKNLQLRTSRQKESNAHVRMSQAASAESEKPPLIRLAHTGGRADGQYNSGNLLTLAINQGVLKREFATDGIQIESTFYPGGPATNEAFARGLVDFGYQATAGLLPARAAGLKQKMLMRIGRNGRNSDHLVVRADSSFQRVADLEGKRLGTITGTAGYLTMCRILERHGLRPADVEIVNFGNAAAIRAALAAGTIDADVRSRPHIEAARGAIRSLYELSQTTDSSTVGVLWVAEEFERRHPAIVQRIVNAIVKLAAWYSDGNNRGAIEASWSELGIGPEEIEKNWAAEPLKRRYSPLLDEFFMAALRRSALDARRWDFITSDVSVDGWVEPKYLRSALEDLKLQEYWPELDASGKPNPAK